MVQVLSSVLRLSARIRGPEPCWIVQPTHHSDGKGTTAADVVVDANDTANKVLTYRTALLSVHQHVGALRTALSAIAGKDITLAYLCSNSLDFALSILAASNLAVTTTRSTTNNNFFPRTIHPALLSTRWTVAEMTAALEPAASIILVFAPNWQEKAKNLCHELTTTTTTTTTRQQRNNQTPRDVTQVSMMPLPQFGARNLAPLSRSTTTSGVQSNANSKPCRNSSHDVMVKDSSNDDAVLVFTSGTTSKPKGVRLSHRALLVQAAAKMAPPCAYNSQTHMLASTVPFFHVGGLSSLLAVWMAGGALVQPSTEGFSPHLVYRSLQNPSFPCNTLVVVPAMVHALQQQQQQQQQGSSTKAMFHVDLILVGGQSLSTRQQSFLRKTFPWARIVQTFACTEAASSLTFWDVTRTGAVSKHSPATPPGVCVGKPPNHVHIQLFDTESSSTQDIPIHKPYQVGVIATRGPHIMTGYWGKPPLKDDWFKLSDYGYWDESEQLYFCGRRTDTIRTGGETVWATEVENILQRHDKVVHVAVVGIPDDRWGETVACAVVCKPKRRVTLFELRSWCQTNGLASYKQPRRIVLLSSDLPRNSSGKILKHRLKDCFRQVPPSHL